MGSVLYDSFGAYECACSPGVYSAQPCIGSEASDCQEASSRCVFSHLQSQTLLLDARGCTAESMPCDGVMPAGLASLPQTQTSGLHIVIIAL